MNFKNKICVVTGGANGIGRCMVENFLAHGARVAVVDIDAARGSVLAEQVGDENLLFVHGDIADEAVLRHFAATVLEKFGGVDILVNNACVSRRGILSGCGFADFNHVLSVGITAPYMLALLFKDAFRPGAAIVNMSSTRAAMSQADTESYTAAKGGIAALTHALSVSLAGIARVNAISPGWIDTGAYHAGGEHYAPAYSPGDTAQHPAKRVGTPHDIAEIAMFLCSEKSGFITGQNIVVDGGMTTQMIYHADHGWTYSG